VFDRSVQGVSLTPHGEMVVNYARRLLSINDQIVHLGGAAPRPELVIRVGTSGDYVASVLPGALARFRERWPDVRFVVHTAPRDVLLRELRSGALDVVVAVSVTLPPDIYCGWVEEMVWVRGAKSRVDADRPVPLVSHGEPCAYHRAAVATLKAAGLPWDDVFTAPSIASLAGAVAIGIGVMPTSRRIAAHVGMTIWEDAPLPKLPRIYRGIYVREGGVRAAYEQLADEMAATLQAPAAGAPKLVALHKMDTKSPAA
jgi:DNA-binding transcriptional LysR family regulator